MQVPPTGWCPAHCQAYAALLYSLLIRKYSWIYSHIVMLKLVRHLLLTGPIHELELAYLRNDAPMLTVILELHCPELPQSPRFGGVRQVEFPTALRPLVRDIYAATLLSFEPGANRRGRTIESPLRALHDATELAWTLETEAGLRGAGQMPDAMTYAQARALALRERANLLLSELEVREPNYYGPAGILRAPTAEYRERVDAVTQYVFHPLLFGRPLFADWEDASGRAQKGSEERLSQHCNAPAPHSSKGKAGMFIGSCQDRAPLGFHWLKGGDDPVDANPAQDVEGADGDRGRSLQCARVDAEQVNEAKP
jgi:hypothetical protein